ncbi:beta-lactamase/transpeptidase-like protein [Hygrophoropsis aurantiaca]|uniref:Beta-lactamase/transpeptidase-like protein n=1 Tax=Hygrophoropsis aurantiaca TaxID=72124 RepID=A0ACB8A5U1_9AGAM|nr:beta-lactamase/transpeptidase-like protein [Hygrophoropsis aurantiaca]
MRILDILLSLRLWAAPSPTNTPASSPQYAAADQSILHLNADVREIMTPEFRASIDSVRQKSGIHGLAMAVIRPDGGVELGGWGERSEEGDPVTSDTLFYIGSCSKAFTGAALGILMDDFASGRNVTSLPPGLTGGSFDWHTKVKDILPGDWELLDGWATDKATIRDILSHVSGMPSQDMSPSSSDSPLDVIRHMRYIRPVFELREKFVYNNQMYVLASHLISTYSGLSLLEFVRERIFMPLNMTVTTYSLHSATESGEMSQAWTSSGRRIPPWITDDTVGLVAGAGGILSSAVDMAKWIRCLLNGGVDIISNRTIIPLSAYTTSTAAQAIYIGSPRSPDQSIVGYGIGWAQYSQYGHNIITHTGGLPGFSSKVDFLRDDGLGIAVLTNMDPNSDALNQLTDKVMDEALMLGSRASPCRIPEDKVPQSIPQRAPDSNNHGLPVENYTGYYASPGYPSLMLCDPSSSTERCKSLLAQYSRVDSAKNHTKPYLIAEWTGFWNKHVRLEYQANGLFSTEFITLFPYGYGADKTPFMVDVFPDINTIAEFVVQDNSVEVVGFGLFRTEGFETEREKRGRSVQEKADVWFTKVSGL